MKLLVVLFALLLLVASATCWSLNDIYSQLVHGKKDKHEKEFNGKRQETRQRLPSKEWSQQAAAPSNYEIQSYDVQASNPMKKNVPVKPHARGVNAVKPTAGLTILRNNKNSLMDFSKKYGMPKPQVSAWTEWSQKSPHEAEINHVHAIKKQERAKPNKSPHAAQPTAAVNLLKNTVNVLKKKNTTNKVEEVSKTVKHEKTHEISNNKEAGNPDKLANIAETNQSYTQPEPKPNPNVHYPGPSFEAPCKPTHDNICPTSPVLLVAGVMEHKSDNEVMQPSVASNSPSASSTEGINQPSEHVIPTETRNGLPTIQHGSLENQNGVTETATFSAETSNQKEDTPELPDIRGILSANFNHQTYKFHQCKIEAVAGVCGVKLYVNNNTCDGKVSFTSLIARLMSNVDLSGPSNELIVHGKFDAHEFSINRCKGYVSFNLTCRELLDIIPNKLRIAKAALSVTFSYEKLPKSIADFDMRISGILDLNFRSRRLNVVVDKFMAMTLFRIEMTATDLELPEFTKLFTNSEISQQELPPDLATLVTSSLRNPRITGLYDESGAFEFIASAKSPASIFPSRPNVYVIIQKPRLGKVVFGLIASFENAMYLSFLSSILNQDLANIPLFSDVQTDMAIGISPDGLFVVKDDSFNKEVGSLFNTGKTIKKGLTIKARLPIRKMITDMSKLGAEGLPETMLINVEVKGNKMHIEFPDEFQIPLSNIPLLFAQHGQDLNFPNQTNIDQTLLQIKSYEIDNIDKKTISVYFMSTQPMKIGSLLTLNDVGATLKRDELSKWSFVATGDYRLGTTSVSVSLTSQNNGFIITSNPSSIGSGVLVELLEKDREKRITLEMAKYHMGGFVIEDFKVAGALTTKNIIRFSGKPALFSEGDEAKIDAKIEFIATEEANKEYALAMGVLFRNVDLDAVFGRMLDRKMQRSSWATGVNIGLILSTVRNGGELSFESEGLAKTKIMPGAHLRVLLMRPEASLCKGDSLCRVLSEEMPHGSAFHLAGSMVNGILKLSAPINDAITLSKSLQLTGASLQVEVVNSVQIYILAAMKIKGIGITFAGDMRVDNTGQLQLNMQSKQKWDQPFGLKNVHFSQSNLSATFEPGLPVPVFDLRSRMLFGKDPEDSTKSIEATAIARLNSQDPSKNGFTAHLRDLSFEKLASACGTKKPLNRFQQEATFTDEGLLSFDQSNKEGNNEGGYANGTDYNYKGDLKVTGRMHIMGQNAEYTIKFLHGESQLLTEVWLPDIGVNQGMLTIRAGLKQQRSDIEVPAPNGPTLLIRMDPFMNSAVIVGKVSTLGFSRISAIKVDDGGFSAKIFGNLPGNVNSDISLRSEYTENIQNADFQASSCLPIQRGIKGSLMKLLQDTASKTKRTLISAEERVTTTEKIYETTKAMIDKSKTKSSALTSDIRQRSEVMLKLRKGIKKHCVKDCGDSCMGLPTWKRSGITLAGRNAIGAPSWDSCHKKIPDLNCITRCLGRKVIENVKANNKQIELQGLMGSLADTKRSLQDARSLVERARKLVDSTLDGLEKVNEQIKVGVHISKFLNQGKSDEAIGVQNVCFKDSLNNAERSLVKFDIGVNFPNETKKFLINAALDGNLDQSMAEGIANQLYPGYFEFSKKLEQVKMLLSNLDGEKAEIEKEIDKTSEGIDQKGEQKSQIVWNTEEDEFRKLAYGELPRFTLSDDETIHAFEEKSIWEMAPTNDPLFDQAPGDNQIVTNKVVNPESFSEELNKQTNCGKIRSSVNRYGDIVNPLSEFTENFLQEKIMFYRQKNRRLADLRMIDDQIKSDCFLENCTMEDMGNALSYLARARDGTLKWSTVIENQIEKQNKAALGYFSKRTADIIQVDKGVTLRQYITKVKEVAQNAIKKSDVGEKSETDDKIQRLAKELHSLLLGVKNSEELSKVAPKIFSMKRQIQNLRRNKIPCSEKAQIEHKNPTAKNDNKLRALKVDNVLKNTTSKPIKTTAPVKKVVSTSKRPSRSQTTKAIPTETENPVLKDTVLRYDDNRMNRKRTESAVNDRYSQSELYDPSQSVQSQYFTNNEPSLYNQYPYWERPYLKKK